MLNHALIFGLPPLHDDLFSNLKWERVKMSGKSLIMPLGFAALALSGLLFQLISHAMHMPVTLLQP